MASMTVYYDREPAVVVNSVEALDELLDTVAASPGYTLVPVFVSIEAPDRRFVLQLGLGRPDLSALVWYDAEADVAASRGTVRYDRRPTFSLGGTPTDAFDDSAVPVAAARQAAREFFTTGRRPTCVGWQEPGYSDGGETVP